MDIRYYSQVFKGIATPKTCPRCHRDIVPMQKFSELTKDVDDIECWYQVWMCSNQFCRKLFGAIYKISDGIPKLDRTFNGIPKGPDWPQPILNLIDGKTIFDEKPKKTKFLKVYLQSLKAELDGLDEIAGMGFRKSIEFLVKDWAIQMNPDEKDKINTMWLSNIITKYFTGDLKDILERATWLGNDQAHYNKLFDDFNIDDLKQLIFLIITDLDREYKKKHYIETIQNKKTDNSK